MGACAESMQGGGLLDQIRSVQNDLHLPCKHKRSGHNRMLLLISKSRR